VTYTGLEALAKDLLAVLKPRPHRILGIDEMIVPVSGRSNPILKMKNKPIKERF
jgi:hypothetical protein